MKQLIIVIFALLVVGQVLRNFTPSTTPSATSTTASPEASLPDGTECTWISDSSEYLLDVCASTHFGHTTYRLSETGGSDSSTREISKDEYIRWMKRKLAKDAHTQKDCQTYAGFYKLEPGESFEWHKRDALYLHGHCTFESK